MTKGDSVRCTSVTRRTTRYRGFIATKMDACYGGYLSDAMRVGHECLYQHPGDGDNAAQMMYNSYVAASPTPTSVLDSVLLRFFIIWYLERWGDHTSRISYQKYVILMKQKALNNAVQIQMIEALFQNGIYSSKAKKPWLRDEAAT